MSIDELIESAEEKSRVHEYHADFFENGNPMRDACLKSSQDCKQLAEWFKQLKEYQTLEEQGKLTKLPCKVGDTVYAIVYDYEVEQYAIKESEIIEVRENINGIFFVSLINKPAFKFNDFGETIFLAKSEAEAKLKELRGAE